MSKEIPGEEFHFGNPKEFFEHFKNAIIKAKKDVILHIIRSDMLEEELVHVLAQLDPEELGLQFFINIGSMFYEREAWELLNIIKTHIEYNFDTKLVKKNGITQYEIRK